MPVAIPAASFTTSIGVEIHDEYTSNWSPYASAAIVDAALAYLNPDGIGTGVSTIRDESGAPTAALAALGQLGYKLDIYTSYNDSGNAAANTLSSLTTLVNDGYVRMIEGPLEVDNSRWGLVHAASYTALNGTTYTGWQAAVEWQKDLYSTFTGKTQVALFSLANPDDGAANSAAVQAASQLGTSLSSISNLGNVHFYEHNGNAPAAEISGVIAQEIGYTPGKGFAITESGFNDDFSGSAASAGYYGTQYSNGVYTLDLVLDAYKAGSTLTDIYELFDENNPSYASAGITFENHWGLFNINGTPKSSAIYLHNMMAVLGDTGSTSGSFTPASLAYTISGLGSSGSSLLFKKNSGALDITVWADANIDTNGVQTTAPAQKVTLALGGSYAEVEIFDPVQGTSAIQTLKNVSSVILSITDHPLIVEIEPAEPTPTRPLPPTPTPTPTSDILTLRMAEDAWSGDAQFVVKVNGAQVGGVQTVSARHSTGVDNVFSLTGTWGGGPKSVQIQFINDAYGGTAAMDRNLYVGSVAYDGVTYSGTTATMDANGTDTFIVGATTPVAAAPADTLTLHLAEDAWRGDAKFTLSIDGKAVSTPQSVVALHSASAWEDLSFAGNLGAGSHIVGVSFTNDSYGGTPTTDRNLYINGLSVNGQQYGSGVTTLMSNGTASFTITTAH